MRIVHLEDHFLPTSGYQINLLSKWHVRHGHEAIIVTSRSLRPWYATGFVDQAMVRDLETHDRKFSAATGVSVIRLPTLGSYSRRQFFGRGLFKVLEGLRPDVVMVHGNDTLTGIRAIRACTQLPYPILLDNHMAEVASQNRFNHLFRRVYRFWVTPKIKEQQLTVVALARDVQDYCVRYYGMPREQMPIVSWGVDTLLFFPDLKVRASFRQEQGIGENDFVLIYTGKISSDKKVHLLAGAVEEPFSHQRKVVVMLVGSGRGDYYDQVKAVLSRCGNRIILFPTQHVTDLARFYQAADVAVWPGACSLSFFDAQACGLPVIAEAIEANQVRITPKRGNGWLYEPDNAVALRRAIANCVDMSAAELAKTGATAADFVKHNFDYETIAWRIEELMSQARDAWTSRRSALKPAPR